MRVPRPRGTSRPLVAIGSRNRAKTLGTMKAFSAFFSRPRFVEVDASSVTRAQPIGVGQILQGASKRATLALSESKADFAVGVEAGLLLAGDEHVNLQVAVVIDRHGNTGIGFSSGFLIPQSFVRKLREEGVELDAYSHEITGAKKITEEEGIVYHITRGSVSRLQMTEQCVGMALIPWLNREAYGLKGREKRA